MDSYANTQFFNDFFNVIFSWRRCRKAVRATGILIPLLGLQFLVFIKRPNDKDSTLYDVYTYAVAIVVSLQVSICKLGINFRDPQHARNLWKGWGVKGGGGGPDTFTFFFIQHYRITKNMPQNPPPFFLMRYMGLKCKRSAVTT